MRRIDDRGREWRAALAAMAATAGAGYASGRELVVFFAQLGWAAWIAVPFACLAFALMIGAVCRCARESGAAGLWRRLGPRAGRFAAWLHALLMAFIAAVMLESAGELGALALPVRGGWLWGAALALAAAGLMNLDGQRLLPWLGLATVLASAAFYAALAIDPRPVRVYLRGETALALRGNPWAAVLLGLAYAAMNACVAGGAVARFTTGRINPSRVAALSGGMLGALLASACAAIARGGDTLLAQAMPTVVLAARWGIAGFWLSVGVGFLCAATTLAAALGVLLDRLREGGPAKRSAARMLALAAALPAAFGLSGALAKGYAALGWACAAGAMGLVSRYDRRAGLRAR